jgi:hypothetical protein
VGKPEEKTQLGKPRRRWADDIKIDHRVIRCGSIDWTNLFQDRDQRANSCENVNKLSASIKY